MKQIPMCFIGATLLCAIGAAGSSAGPDVIKPYYYQGAGRTLSATDRQQLTVYRNQLETQQQAEQLQLYQASFLPRTTLSPLARPANPAVVGRGLLETQIELDRVNGLLRSAHAAQFPATAPAIGFAGHRLSPP